DLPQWVQNFNSSRPAKFWNREWKDSQGTILGSTAHRKNANGSDAGFYEVVGSTGFGNEYELEFAKELMVYENAGRGPATDLLAISLSPNDSLGHQVGLANVWIALSADHGVSTLPDAVKKQHIPAANLGASKLEEQINNTLSTKFSPGHPAHYIKLDYPDAWLDEDAFTAAHLREKDAEIAVGEALKQVGLRDYYTKSQLAEGEAPNTPVGHKYLNSYSPVGSWYVLGVPDFYTVGSAKGTDHASPYNYDTHVPLVMYGLPFRAGTYRNAAEPVDLVPTLASLLGINPPTASVGRVLTEALAPSRREGEPQP